MVGQRPAQGARGPRLAVSKVVLNRSLFPNEFLLLGYLHSKQEKEEQLWAGEPEPTVNTRDLWEKFLLVRRDEKLKDKSGQGGRCP